MLKKLNDLIEQTAFLLKKQIDAREECQTIFAEVLSIAQDKKKHPNTNKEEQVLLQKIYDLISSQVSSLTTEATTDISFLQEQLEALNKIKNIENKEKAAEMLDLILDPNEEVKDTALFKKELEEESAISKQNLLMVISDIKQAILEGGAEEVAAYFESLLDSDDNTDDEECDDEDCDDEDCCESHEEYDDDDDDCNNTCTCGLNDKGKTCTCKKKSTVSKKQGGCGGCNGCSGGGCGSGCSSENDTDIFANLSMYQKEFLDSDNKKNKN